MSNFDRLASEIAEQAAPGAKLMTLLTGLAERIKSAPNDQNIQRLSRELSAAAPHLVQAVTADANGLTDLRAR